MKAVYFNAYGGPEVLNFGELPDPVPGKDQILIQIKAVSINPVDYKIRQGSLKIMTGSNFPQIPCSDFAGIVRVTNGNTGFNPCDKVYGSVPTLLRKPGSLAELTIASTKQIRRLPEGMVFEEAASFPVACLTALNGIHRGGELKGKSVLVNGATGGVGHFAVQLARIKGAVVTGICSSPNHDLAIQLGCSEVYDHSGTYPASLKGRFDLIMDAWGKMNTADIFMLLKKNGVYATTQLRPSTFLTIPKQMLSGKKMTSASMRANDENYNEIESLFKKGLLRPYVEHTFELKDAVEAFRLAESGKHRGKIVIRI